MSIGIDPHSSEPLYLQIVHELISRFEAGSLDSGKALPSTEALAQEHTLNPSIIKRALDHLLSLELVEIDEFGTYHFTSLGTETMKKQSEIKSKLVAICREAKTAGLHKSKLIAWINKLNDE